MKKLAIPKLLRLPLLFGIPILLVLLALWLVQQKNIDSLEQQTNALKTQIDNLPSTVPANKEKFGLEKEKLSLEKDRLTLEQSRVNAQNAIYSTLLQALGGVFFFVTAYFTYRNVRATEANVKAAEDKQITERFSKSIEQLGSDKLEVRLGGIYALERISIDSEKDYWTIMEVLSSFIRERSPLQQDKAKTYVESFINEQQNASLQETGKVATDVQAALTVIGRRDSSKDPKGKYIDLSSASLPRANLSGANLSGANLFGAYLSRANLFGAYLSEAYLFKANLSRAILEEANLSEANLSEANLSGAYLSGANLSGAILFGANLSGADLSRADLSRANLSRANLEEADLRGVKNLTPEQLKDVDNKEEACYDLEFRKQLGLQSKNPKGCDYAT